MSLAQEPTVNGGSHLTPTFLHRRGLLGHEDGEGHRAQMLTSHLRADLLLPPPPPLQLVGGQGQGHGPQGGGKQDLPQAWCQPQLRECRLQGKRGSCYISPESRERTGPWGYLQTRGAATSREGTWPAALKCGHTGVKRGLGMAK